MQSQEKNGRRIIYLDVLRIAAAFAVIILHVASQNWGNPDVSFYDWVGLDLWDACVQWAVPVFIMISGALFLDRKKEINIKRLYLHNIFRIITAFLCWSLIYSVWQVHVEGGGIPRIMALVLDGHYHMWFLFMIIALYMLTPLLKKLSDDKLKYLLILSLLFCFVLPTVRELKDVIVSFCPNDTVNKTLNQLFSPYNRFIVYFKPDYIAYYILGYFLHNMELEKKQRRLICIFSLMSFVFTVVFSAVVTYFRHTAYGIYDIFTVNMLLESVGVFVFFKQSALRFQKMSDKKRSLIFKLSDCGFGIYLIHALIIEILDVRFSVNSLKFMPVWWVPVLALAVFAISLAVIVPIKKIPKLSKYMV